MMGKQRIHDERILAEIRRRGTFRALDLKALVPRSVGYSWSAWISGKLLRYLRDGHIEKVSRGRYRATSGAGTR